MPTPTSTPPGRNEPCHCGSGRKYKHCCLGKDEAEAAKARAAAREATDAEAVNEPAGDAAPAAARPPKHQTHQPWKAGTSRGFAPRTRSPRKVGGG